MTLDYRKQFLFLQYKWIRMLHPAQEVAHNPHHPLHQIDLEISHEDYVIKLLIDDIIGRKGIFNVQDIEILLNKFAILREKTLSIERTKYTDDFTVYIDKTIALLRLAIPIITSQ